ncbi:TPA: hypothetical protein L6A41_36765 [Pseudomonas aeruginosa]|nr:hypothetical protein EGY27_11465 [Pseudomonas aeruginosa]AZZ13830.1 hypothetical protein CEK59_20100 [Pseudomonas aeruginosa]KJC12209.1 hypothetical protein TO65_32230 [Pseudomonas aeruginosa]KSP95562.1 hypothetical protein APB25_31505 [Pseudomonas aeruginosa]KSQ45720.1 hypothetical protein APB23_28810 [Pseudomonas aeruginosa]
MTHSMVSVRQTQHWRPLRVNARSRTEATRSFLQWSSAMGTTAKGSPSSLDSVMAILLAGVDQQLVAEDEMKIEVAGPVALKA